MKRLNTATNGTATLEVIECDCGYHMGIDASYVEQVDDAFFGKTICPSCKEEIPVRAILGMEPIEVDMEVSRECVAFNTVTVVANSEEEARRKALDKAGDYVFSEKDANYEVTDNCWHAVP